MRLEDLTVALRPRRPWEAVDLGCALVRRDYGRILALWGATVVPVWLVLAVVMRNHPQWYALVVWWLKPLYDRVPLHFVSRAAFGVRPGFVETWKQWPRLWSLFLLPALLWRRLSLVRSFALPVLMLEGQRGSAAWSRVKALASDGGSSGSMATWAFYKLELVVLIGVYSLTSSLAPETGLPGFFSMMDGGEIPETLTPAFLWYFNGLYLVAITVIEPFYVGAGFGLYLNSRTHLEGWDIELTFRRLAARLAPVAAVLILGLTVLLQGNSTAQTPSPFREPSDPQPVTTEVKAELANAVSADDEAHAEVQEAIKAVLADPDFEVHTRKERDWVSNRSSGHVRQGGEPALAGLAVILFWGLIGFLVAGIIYLIYVNRHLIMGRVSVSAASDVPDAPQGPRIIMGMDIGRASLPSDIVAAARQVWRAGDYRQALSLLYRGALSRLVEQRELPVRDSDTEDDCLAHVRRSARKRAGGDAEYFYGLSRTWMRAAYAGEDAGEGEFETLCRQWPFDAMRAGTGGGRALPNVLLALFMLPTLVGCSGKWEEVERTIGYKGKARADCFLAARRMLDELDFGTEKRASLGELPDADGGVVFLSAESVVSASRAEMLMRWVNQGGHLIYAMAGCTPYNDWVGQSVFAETRYVGNEDREDNVLQRLGVTTAENSREDSPEKAEAEDDEPEGNFKKATVLRRSDVWKKKMPMFWAEVNYQVEVADTMTFKIGRQLRFGEYVCGTTDHAYLLGLRSGRGRVTLLNHARPLRNRYLGEHDHAALLHAMVNATDAWDVIFIMGAEKSFLSLLWERAWMVIVSLAVVLIFWLWGNVPRFGPLRSPVLHDTRHFVDHIASLGGFFFRVKRSDILWRDAAALVRRIAQARFPQLVAAGDAELFPHMAIISGVPLDRVQAAFAEPKSDVPPYQFVSIIQDLQTLRQSL